MSDDDDFITVNITCEQSTALTVVLLAAGEAGMFEMLPRDLKVSLMSFVNTMVVEIDRQKLNALGS